MQLFSIMFIMLFGIRSFSLKISKKVSHLILPDHLPISPNQKTYCEMLKDSRIKIVVGTGDAGTGKTLFATKSAIEYLTHNHVKKIIITRAVVNLAHEEIGFLPGTLGMKMQILTKPVMDILLKHFTKEKIEKLLLDETIEVIQLCSSMKGHTYDDSFIIVDEVQNTTPEQLLTILTRIGKRSKMVLTGDPKQVSFSAPNGLVDFTNRFNTYKKILNDELKINELGIGIVEFNSGDIQRSQTVRNIIEMYDATDKCNNPSTETKNNIIKNDAAIIPKSDVKPTIFDNYKKTGNNDDLIYGL